MSTYEGLRGGPIARIGLFGLSRAATCRASLDLSWLKEPGLCVAPDRHDIRNLEEPCGVSARIQFTTPHNRGLRMFGQGTKQVKNELSWFLGQPYRALILPELFGRILSAIFGTLANGAESRKRLNREIDRSV
jgi:hypothetical protein